MVFVSVRPIVSACNTQTGQLAKAVSTVATTPVEFSQLFLNLRDLAEGPLGAEQLPSVASSE